jgi:Zn-dependent protease
VSIGAYTLFWGLPFAIGFVALLFIHEMGHVLELRRLGIKASAPMFIPFLGAMIAAKELGKDAYQEARVGLAGPIVGTIGTLGVIGLYALTGNQLFQALAYFGFFLNLLNLLPVLPLDGGRAMAAVSPKLWIVGLIALLPLSFMLGSPIFLIIVLLLGGFELFHRFRSRHSESSKAYHQVPASKRLLVLGVYLALVVGLLIGMDMAYIDDNQLRTIQDS